MPKTFITGTGRSGTTFLIILYTHLGLDTGFTESNYQNAIQPVCNSGMEKSYDYQPQIIKNPQIIHQIPEIINSGTDIRLIIIPIRDYEKSAHSRVRIGNGAGGLWNANNQEEQVSYYHKIMAEYLVYMVDYNIPTIFVSFEQMISSPEYLYNKLKPSLQDISYDKFLEAYNKATEHQTKK